MMKEKLLQRLDDLIELGNRVVDTRNQTHDPFYVDGGKMKEFRTASLSFIGRVYGEKHTHYTEFFGTTKGYSAPEAENGLGILSAIRGEIDGGWLFTIKGLVTAEVFTDYMETAEYLLESGYKDPAAVIAGSTLEEHLRQLCRTNGIPVTRQRDGRDVPLKAEQLNSDLTKAEVYTRLDQKQVTAWLELRNNAAHGKYDAYNVEQVKAMITGVIEFMARIAA